MPPILIAAGGLTVTLSESEAMAVAEAVTVVVQGVVAVPPYAGWKNVLTCPAGMVTLAGTVTQAAFAEVSVTVRSDGAATPAPALSSCTVCVGPGKPWLNEMDDDRMLRFAALETAVEDEAYPLRLTVTEAVPALAPRTVAFTESAPAGTVTCGVITSMMAALALATSTCRPPGGATLGPTVIGTCVV